MLIIIYSYMYIFFFSFCDQSEKVPELKTFVYYNIDLSIE